MSTRSMFGSWTAWVTSAPSTGQNLTPSSNERRQRGQLVTSTVLAPGQPIANGTRYYDDDSRAFNHTDFDTQLCRRPRRNRPGERDGHADREMGARGGFHSQGRAHPAAEPRAHAPLAGAIRGARPRLRGQADRLRSL